MSDNSKEQLENLLRDVSKYLNTNPESLRNSAQKGDLSQTLKNLDPEDAKKIQHVLSDKEAASKILSTPQAQKLLKNLLGER